MDKNDEREYSTKHTQYFQVYPANNLGKRVARTSTILRRARFKRLPGLGYRPTTTAVTELAFPVRARGVGLHFSRAKIPPARDDDDDDERSNRLEAICDERLTSYKQRNVVGARLHS